MTDRYSASPERRRQPLKFGDIIRTAREERCWNRFRLSQEARIDHSYIKKIENDGFPPSRLVTEDLARALELDLTHALVHAGYVPELSAEEWETILLDLRTQQLHPEMRAALRGLEGLDAGELRKADRVLLGTINGFRAARRRSA